MKIEVTQTEAESKRNKETSQRRTIEEYQLSNTQYRSEEILAVMMTENFQKFMKDTEPHKKLWDHQERRIGNTHTYRVEYPIQLLKRKETKKKKKILKAPRVKTHM